MNPNGLVPLLRDDETDATLWESNTIVRYLAAQYGQGRLWVENPAQRAQGEKWMDWANQTLSPTHRVILMDDELAKQTWFSGDTFGVGDIAVAPFVWNLTNMGLSWTPRPHLQRWIQQLSERPAYRNVVMIPVT